MDSALRLRYGAVHIPSTSNRLAKLARTCSSSRPPSLSLLYKASTYHLLSRHTFSSPVICALNQPSTPSPNYDRENCKTFVPVLGGAYVALACALAIINFNYRINPSAIACESSSPPMVMTMPKDALNSLLKVNNHLAAYQNTENRKFKIQKLWEYPAQSEPADRDNLKMAVADLIKSGMCDEAEEQLIKLYDDTKKKNGSIPANDVEMELAVLLIFKGEYEKALKLGCLKVGNGEAGVGSDGRVQLYKAICHTMLGQDEEASNCWNSFISSFQNKPPGVVGPGDDRNQRLSEEPSMYDCDEFLQAAKIVCRNAETQLRRLHENIMATWKKEGGKVYPQTAYHVENGIGSTSHLPAPAKYEDASQCMCLRPDIAITTDGRVPLYKAIIYTMLEPKHQDEEALQNYREEAMWETFVNLSSTAIPSWQELQGNTTKSEVETKKERRVPR